MQPLPLGITPHKLRHSFASIRVAIGEDTTYGMRAARPHGPGYPPTRLLACDAPQRG